MIDFFFNQGLTGITALFTGLIYVFLAANQDRRCWYFGILSCSLIAYDDIVRYQLYSDAVLQLFYVLAGFVGLITWKKFNFDSFPWNPLKKSSTHALAILTMIILSWILVKYVWVHTNASVPWLDSFTTLLSVWATLLLVGGLRINWIYWIIANSLYLYIYGSQGAWAFFVLMIIYWVMAVYGWVSWGKLASDGTVNRELERRNEVKSSESREFPSVFGANH